MSQYKKENIEMEEIGTYEKISPITRKEAVRAFDQGNSEEIASALLSVTFHDEDWQWVQAQCLRFLKSPDKNVRAVAATCLGHLARTHGIIDIATVVQALQALLSDPDLAGRASDALDDIEMFATNVPQEHANEQADEDSESETL